MSLVVNSPTFWYSCQMNRLLNLEGTIQLGFPSHLKQRLSFIFIGFDPDFSHKNDVKNSNLLFYVSFLFEYAQIFTH